MSVRGRVFGPVLRRVSEIPNILFQRFKVSVVGVLKILGPVEIEGDLEISGTLSEFRMIGQIPTIKLHNIDDPGNIIVTFRVLNETRNRWEVDGNGQLAWRSSNSQVAATFLGLDETAEHRLRISNSVNDIELRLNGHLGLEDGITAPSTTLGFGQLYIDTADGDLKIKFGDGTVVVIASGGSTLTTVEIDRRYALLVG